MLKKTLSAFLAIVMMVSSFAILSPVFAQTEEDVINSIPIVEYVAVGNTRNGNSDYDSAKVIYVTKDKLVSENKENLKSLIKETNVIFFKDVDVGEIGEYFKVPGFTSESSDSSILLGTSVTLFDGIYHFVESTVMKAELEIEEEPDYDYEADESDTDITDSALIITEADYEYAARSAYADAKVFGYTEIKGNGFPSGFTKILTGSCVLKKKNKDIAKLAYTAYFYDLGNVNVNNSTYRLYDYITVMQCSPIEKTLKVKFLDITLGHEKLFGRIIDVTRIPSQGVTKDVEVSFSPEVSFDFGSGDIGISLGLGFARSWSYSSDAFTAVNRFGYDNKKQWEITPKNPLKGDSWQMEPGIRTYVTSGHPKPDFLITFTGKLRTGFLSSAKGTLSRCYLHNKY